MKINKIFYIYIINIFYVEKKMINNNNLNIIKSNLKKKDKI
jgi:hypothetical protein